ncbi:hypothetical protein [Streptomyces sp. NPDC050263]|uniref:hypothetical protein n=1 Tax=Streptomyces sp. NPDC050263 TaxID=3155037 RepID=UPI0034162CC3
MDMQTWRDSRSRADAATTALREALVALGLPERVQRHLRPLVTHSGSPFVHVGVVPAEHIERIAEALRAAGASAQEVHDSHSG